MGPAPFTAGLELAWSRSWSKLDGSPPLIVMETIPISPLLRDVSIPIISLDMLKKKLERTKKPSTEHGQ
jgi:hypothetical protein